MDSARPAHWPHLPANAWFGRVEYVLDKLEHKTDYRTTFLRDDNRQLSLLVNAVTEENRQTRERVTQLETVMESLQADLKGVMEENRRLREPLENRFHLVAARNPSMRVTPLEAVPELTELSTSAWSTSAGSQPASVAAEQQPTPAAAIEEPPPPPPPLGPTPPAVKQPPPAPGLKVVPYRASRAHPCPRCRHANGGPPPSCDVADIDWNFNRDWAEVSWQEGPAYGRHLLELFQYQDTEYNHARFENSGRTRIEHSVLHGASGRFAGNVLAVLERALKDDSVEMVFHRTNTGRYCCLALMCKQCRFAFSLQMGKPDEMRDNARLLRTSLARWLGVAVPDNEAGGR